MAMVPAICTQCGGRITVDDTHDAGICEFCGTAFVTERAINNYHNTINIDNATINVAGVDIGNLLLRAQAFERENDRDKAIEYYNKVLDIDINNVEANNGIERLRPKVYYIGLTPVSKSVCDEIEGLIAKGEKIPAIKVVREATNCSLVGCKYFVEHHITDNWEAYDLEKAASSNSGNQSGGCYIATAVYGSYDCPQVWTLRRYRDYTLTETWYGRLFIRVYYAISPALVRRFGKTEWFKNLWKPKLDRMVERLNNEGVENTPYADRDW